MKCSSKVRSSDTPRWKIKNSQQEHDWLEMDGDCRVVAVCRKVCPKSEKRRGAIKSLQNGGWLWLPSKSLGSELADRSPRIRLSVIKCGRLSFSFVQIIAFPSTNKSTNLGTCHLPQHIYKQPNQSQCSEESPPPSPLRLAELWLPPSDLRSLPHSAPPLPLSTTQEEATTRKICPPVSHCYRRVDGERYAIDSLAALDLIVHERSANMRSTARPLQQAQKCR